MFRNKRNTTQPDAQTTEAIEKHMPNIVAGLAGFLEVPTRQRLDDLVGRITDLEKDANKQKPEPLPTLSEVIEALETLRIRIASRPDTLISTGTNTRITQELQGIENTLRGLQAQRNEEEIKNSKCPRCDGKLSAENCRNLYSAEQESDKIYLITAPMPTPEELLEKLQEFAKYSR